MSKVVLFDSSLRDGAQAEGITFSVEDKMKILRSLRWVLIMWKQATPPRIPRIWSFSSELAVFRWNMQNW